MTWLIRVLLSWHVSIIAESHPNTFLTFDELTTYRNLYASFAWRVSDALSKLHSYPFSVTSIYKFFPCLNFQAALGTALRAADEDRAARRAAENRLRTSSDVAGQLAARLDRIERRQAADDESNAGLMEHLRNSEAEAIAMRQELMRRQDEQAAR